MQQFRISYMVTAGLFSLVLLVTALLDATTPALAQTPKLLTEHKDWAAYAFSDKKNGRTCFMTSTPVNKKPAKVKHGDVYVMVTHRPKAKIRDEVSVNVGYPLKPRSEVAISVGKKSHKMYTSVDTAWSYEEKDDRKLVSAMKAGDDMKVQGLSKRGTRVTYRFSLSGFTKAYNAISKACKK
jgi:invasion protein IalB